MARYALLLRGVNVGTKNKLPMADLRQMLEKLGCEDISTYVQSGNAVLTTPQPKAEFLAAAEKLLGEYMGRPIATTVRTKAELDVIVEKNPFEDVADNPKYLCVTFLSGRPKAATLAPLKERDWEPERFHVSGHQIYTWYPEGQARSELASALRKLRFEGTATTRNWNTVLKLQELLSAD
jgi:uncharacterized protein (DUF1697 family)